MAEYILIVDDHLGFRRLMEEILCGLGYRTRTASNGCECLKIAVSAEKPTLILLDYQMPFMDGIEVLSFLKKNDATREIPVIMVSAEDNLAEMAEPLGAAAILSKPIDLNILVQELDGFFSKGSRLKDIGLQFIAN